ncbi:MAG: type II toxin-antitoxin system mRNA interferase toxin, RelE/StbE family [Proteobacteria bacterium]|nr:MAG: type II toxin-antitoxin system mRNA interferase toxin, RelE/StbE family [Pseudomonadota bacterium]
MSYKIVKTSLFKKGMKKFIHDRKLSDEIENLIQLLADNRALDLKYKDHSLKGNLKGLRDCHIRPDVALIYQKDQNALILTAIKIGSHSEIFK